MTVAISAGRGHYPGEGLTHPIALAALVALILNDHVLKANWPGFWTGKLSDLAGVIFFPLLLQAAWELLCEMRRRPWHPSMRVLAVSAIVTLIAVSAVEVNPWSANAVGQILGLLQWPVAAAIHVLKGTPAPPLYAAVLTPDLTDLFALAALLVPWMIGRDRTRL